MLSSKYSALLLSSVLVLSACGEHNSNNTSYRRDKGDVFVGSDPADDMGRMSKAIGTDDLSGVTDLLDAGLDVNTMLPNGRSLLIDATVQVKYRIIAELLARGADVDLQDASGRTALDHAQTFSADGTPIYNRAWILLDNEAQISQRQELMKFAGRGSSAAPILTLLQEIGVDPNFLDEATGDTPLTLAIRKKKKISAEALAIWTDCPTPSSCIRLTAIDLNLPAADGMTPLALAKSLSLIESGPPKAALDDIVNLLTRLGAKE